MNVEPVVKAQKLISDAFKRLDTDANCGVDMKMSAGWASCLLSIALSHLDRFMVDSRANMEDKNNTVSRGNG